MKWTFLEFQAFEEVTWYEDRNQLCFQAHLTAVWSIMVARFIFSSAFLFFKTCSSENMVPQSFTMTFLSMWNFPTANRKWTHFQWGKSIHSRNCHTEFCSPQLRSTACDLPPLPTIMKYLSSTFQRMQILLMLGQRGKLVELWSAK